MAGAGYKLFSTGDVLSASDVNTYLMQQTVMSFASAAARTTALSGILAEGLVSYLQDTNVVEIYTGAAWVSLDDPNAIQNSIVDAKGDLLTATADNTPARLAVGTNAQVLTADSTAATGLKWATASGGALTLLSTTSLTLASTTISVVGGYKDLQVFISGVTNATGSGYFRIAPNGTTNAASSIENYAELTTAYAGATNGGYIALTSFALRTDANNAAVLYISNYASAATYKPYNYRGGFLGTGNYQSFTQSGIFKDITAITSLVISNSGGNLSTGTVLVYGVN